MMLHEIARIVLPVMAGVLLIGTLMPFVRVAHGAVRIFDFPRTQFLTLALLTLAGYAVPLATGRAGWLTVAAVLACLVVVAVQLWHILRFTRLWRRTVPDRSPGEGEALTLLVSNVKQGNKDTGRVIRMIAERDPDIVLVIETNDRWAEALQETVARYPFRIVHPLPTGYGMILATRLKVRRHAVEFLLNKEVPSFDLVLESPDGRPFRLVAVHPEPPVPHAASLGRDAEILLVAERVKDEALPVIVTGDLNDVAWSGTTRRFLRLSRLLDPREGRGQYNSFHADWPFLRWPLDHMFVSPHFTLDALERVPSVGSDHFPMFFSLVLTRQEKGEEPEQADGEDVAEARETIANGRRHSHERPIGADWEDD